MLKKRVIPVLLLKNNRMVKGKNFSNYRDTGDPVSQAKIYNAHNADELVFLDIEATNLKSNTLVGLIEKVAQECFMPLTVGGGINSLDDVRNLIKAGADKVIINSAAINNFSLINEASKHFGKQAIIVSIDLKFEDGKYVIYTHSGNRKESVEFSDHIKLMQEAGAGEFLINSIDQDGLMSGYDLKLLEETLKHATIPVILSGGARDFEDLYQGLYHGAHAVACASLFHFGDNNPTRARSFLLNKGIAMKNLKPIGY